MPVVTRQMRESGMRTVYKTLAFILAIEVAVQAAAMVYAVAGLGLWVDQDGGVLDKAALENENLFPEDVGFAIHAINGMMVIPLLALVLLIVSFFAKVPGGIKFAGLVLLAVVVQALLGIFGHELAVSGMLHGVNALVLFSLAAYTGLRVNRQSTTAAARQTDERLAV
jgi:hypothetical protein